MEKLGFQSISVGYKGVFLFFALGYWNGVSSQVYAIPLHPSSTNHCFWLIDQLVRQPSNVVYIFMNCRYPNNTKLQKITRTATARLFNIMASPCSLEG